MFAFRSAARFAAVLACAVGFGIVAQAGAEPAVGSQAPEVKAKGWLNGEGTTLASLNGKVAIVEFWATWCPPCRRSIPHLIELHERKAKDGLVIVALTNEAKEKVEPFAKDMKMTYLIGYGSDTGEDYGVQGIPHAFVVGRDGKIVWAGNPLKTAELDKAVDTALSATKG